MTPSDRTLLGADAFARRVATERTLGRAVDFHQLREVDVSPEGTLNGFEAILLLKPPYLDGRFCLMGFLLG